MVEVFWEWRRYAFIDLIAVELELGQHYVVFTLDLVDPHCFNYKIDNINEGNPYIYYFFQI